MQTIADANKTNHNWGRERDPKRATDEDEEDDAEDEREGEGEDEDEAELWMNVSERNEQVREQNQIVEEQRHNDSVATIKTKETRTTKRQDVMSASGRQTEDDYSWS